MNNTQIEERFLNFSPETIAAISDYQRTRDPTFVMPIVQGILRKYLPEERRHESGDMETSLTAFGLESLTMLEVILDIQDALGLVISDDELRALKNFGEAITMLSARIDALRQSNSAAS